MRRILLLLPILILAACNNPPAQPIVVVATAGAPDAAFQTYNHNSGVFNLRVPPEWIPDSLPSSDGVRMQFTSIEGNERIVRLSVMVVNTGLPMTAETFIQAVNAYQPPSDLSSIPWRPSEPPASMSDGSVRLSGIREYPALGPRALNIFLQGNGSYFSALEVDVTSATPETLERLMAVINTFQVNPDARLSVGEIAPPGITSASGELAFENLLYWSDGGGGFNITGQIVNTDDDALEAIRLTAYLYDDQNNALAERSDILSYDVLGGGESAPFRLRFDTGRPTTAIRYELHAAARAAEFSINTFYGNENFVIAEDQAGYNAQDQLTISGIIQNNQGQLAQDVKILATVFNEAGQVVAAETSFLGQTQLLPGEAARFQITIYDLGGNPFRYTLLAQGTKP